MYVLPHSSCQSNSFSRASAYDVIGCDVIGYDVIGCDVIGCDVIGGVVPKE